MKDKLIAIRHKLLKAVEDKDFQSVMWAINDLDTFIYHNGDDMPKRKKKFVVLEAEPLIGPSAMSTIIEAVPKHGVEMIVPPPHVAEDGTVTRFEVEHNPIIVYEAAYKDDAKEMQHDEYTKKTHSPKYTPKRKKFKKGNR